MARAGICFGSWSSLFSSGNKCANFTGSQHCKFAVFFSFAWKLQSAKFPCLCYHAIHCPEHFCALWFCPGRRVVLLAGMTVWANYPIAREKLCAWMWTSSGSCGTDLVVSLFSQMCVHYHCFFRFKGTGFRQNYY